jgi:hypothetical protein
MFWNLEKLYDFNPFFSRLEDRKMPDVIKNNGIRNPNKNTFI